MEQEKPQFPDVETFEAMSVEDKVLLFLTLPEPAQKLLVGCSSFAASVRPDMAIIVSKLDQEKFEEAKAVLSETPFFSVTENDRLQVTDQMKHFIKTDLTKVWEEQKAKNNT